MKAEELQKILQNDKKLTIEEVQDILCELKQDCFKETYRALNKETADFYHGEINAFYICLDLLEKVNNK